MRKARARLTRMIVRLIGVIMPRDGLHGNKMRFANRESGKAGGFYRDGTTGKVRDNEKQLFFGTRLESSGEVNYEAFLFSSAA